MNNLHQAKVAILAVDGFEESELTEPKRALEEAGANVEVVSEHSGEIQGYRHDQKGQRVKVDRTLDEIHPDEYSGIVLPGGSRNAAKAREIPRLRQIIWEMDRARKPIAAICHGPWELVSADLVTGRRMTSAPKIQDDLRRAGAEWEDAEVVVDQNWVTSRGPQDLPAFNRETIALLMKEPVLQER
jgi:protease I